MTASKTQQMNPTIDIVRGELERLFTLEELTKLSERLLGLAPAEVGGHTAKGSFALALTERCFDGDRIDALVDVILHSRKDVDPRVRDIVGLLGKEELPVGRELGDFTIQKKVGESDLGIVYQAVRKDGQAKATYTLKVLRREAVRDRRAVHRFLTANRLVSMVEHEGLPKHLEAGEIAPGTFYVAYEWIGSQPLSSRVARTGPTPFAELRPILRAILEPLAAVHKAQLAHGDLRMDSILVTARPGAANAFDVQLIDFGSDRLRHRGAAANGHAGLLAVYGSPKTVAPEIVRGRPADARTDVYAFGAILYELLTGKPVFHHESATDAAFAHLASEPEPASKHAPRGTISSELDAFVSSLLEKDPARRPKDAGAVLDALDALSTAPDARAGAMSDEKLQELIDALLAAPGDVELALTLENAVEQGASAGRVAEAFVKAAGLVTGETDDDKETKKTLLFRGARIFDGAARDKARAEQTYATIFLLDPEDVIATVALEEVRKALGKFDEVVEMLLERSQSAPPGEERGRALAEIGRLYAVELNDSEQATVAYVQALCEVPTNEDYASEVERLCGTRQAAWNEHLTTIAEACKSETLSQPDQLALMTRAARWYEQKVGRADLALGAYQYVLAAEPANEAAAEGMTGIYRRAQQWPELVTVLLARADVAPSAPKARDLRAEAAEVIETRLSDTARARDLYMTVLAEDPGHARTCDAIARIAERGGDFATLAQVLERRAEARRGIEKADALVKVAEVYEDRLNDLPEATRRFEAVLAIDPTNLSALKGLDRIYSRSHKYRELLEVLEKQINVAATPRQKINLYERVAGLHDEEFLDHEAAAKALEAILAVDGAHDGALSSLVRHYRALEKWELACSIYEKHAAVTSDTARRIDLLLARARTLAEQIGSPERATKVYEQILAISPSHAGALEALAHLREMSGDAHAALSAIETLAAKAATPEAKAEQWTRAARLLEARGDKDGAIERFKLALDANPRDAAAGAALRKSYAQRGEWQSVVALIERELTTADSELARARLLAELAKVSFKHLGEPVKAESSAKRALELDPTNADALMVLGDLAFEAGRMIEAAKHLESLVSRTSILAKDDAVRVLVRFMEAFGKSQPKPVPAPAASTVDLAGPLSSVSLSSAQGRASMVPSAPNSLPPPPVTNPKMVAAVDALTQLAPHNVDALARAANALFDFGDAKSAYSMHEELFRKHGGELAGADRAEALFHLGESARRSGDLQAAIAPLKEAIDLDPSNPRPYRSLARVYDERQDWKEAVAIRRARLLLASGIERFELLLEIGDVLFAKLDDRTGASKAYTDALEERPGDRKLLAKLMQLYSETQDWSKLVDVVLRLADFVEEPKQRAKYMHTAATIASRHTGEIDKALTFYAQTLELEPANEKALSEAIELYRQRGQNDEVERLLKAQLDQAKVSQDRGKIVQVLDKLGELYLKFLGEPDLAVDALEAAQAFDPEDRARADKLAEIYAADPAQYLDKAVAAQAAMLKRNPYRVESYKLLRKLYTDSKRADAAWCLCQALATLRLAEADEERFYRKHRSESAAPAQATFDADAWSKLMHWDIDPLVTQIFALIQPTIVRTRTQPLEQLGFDLRYAIDTSVHPYAVSQTLYYVQGVVAMPPVVVFQNPKEESAFGTVHARTPAIVLGKAAFDNTLPNQALAFLAGRHLTSFRPGFYVRHLVPTGTGLKAWLFAAIKSCVPQFPVSPELQGQVDEAMAAIAQDFVGGEKDKLASAVSKLLQAGGALDLKKWVAAVDLTADRVGFLLAHDLHSVTEVIRATEDATSVPVKERMKDMVLFSVSEDYFALRHKLSITIDG